MSNWNEKIASFAEKIDTCIDCDDIDSLVRFCDELKKLISDESEAPDIVKSVLTIQLHEPDLKYQCINKGVVRIF